MRLGKNQLNMLCGIARPGTAYVVPCKMTQSLIKKGVARAMQKDGAFVYITAQGLRQLANAAEEGRITLRPNLPKRKSPQPFLTTGNR